MSCDFCTSPLPSSAELERCVLSGMMQSPDTQVTAALRVLSVSDFALDVHGLLFDIIVRRHTNGDPVDPVSIIGYLYEKGMTDKVGGPSYVSETFTASPDAANTAHYATTVLDFSKRRQMARIATEMARVALAGGSGEESWLEASRAVLGKADAILRSDGVSALTTIGKVAFEYSEAFEKNVTEGIGRAVPTGIKSLDNILHGGLRKEYILIGGRQGQGKSLLAMQFAGVLAADGQRGLIVGYDMTAMEVFMRDLAREVEVPVSQIMGREQIEGRGVFQNMTRGIVRLSKWDVHYTKSPYVTLDDAISHARTLHRQKPLDFLVVDYLQKVPFKRIAGLRTDEILTSIGNQLDRLQKELACTLIAPVQINDDGLVRESRGLLDSPQLSLRIEMDDLENDAGDVVSGDTGFIRITKNRFGQSNRRCPVFRNGPLQRFEDREYTRPEPKGKTRRWHEQ